MCAHVRSKAHERLRSRFRQCNSLHVTGWYAVHLLYIHLWYEEPVAAGAIAGAPA